MTATTTTTTSLIDELLRSFCPPLDSSLIHAIASDLPSTEPDPQQVDDIRNTLKNLAEEADMQQRNEEFNRGFNSSLKPSHPETRSSSPSNTNGEPVESLERSFEVWSLDEDGTTSTASSSVAGGMIGGERPDDPLAFLCSVFPDQDLGVLQLALEQGNGDLENVVEELLSSDLLRDAEKEQRPIPKEDGLASGSSSTLSKQQKKRLKAVQKASTTLSLTSTPHLTSPTTLQLLEKTLDPTPISIARPTENHWASLSSHASNLAVLLHVPESTIVSTYHASSSSLPLTLARLLNRLPIERPFSSLPESIQAKEQLELILPDLSDDKVEVLLCASEGNVSDAMDLWRTINQIERDQGKMFWSQILELEPEETSQMIKAPRSPSTLQTPPITSKVVVGKESYSSSDCENLELEYLNKRNLALRSAARHFQKGSSGDRGAAYYWAEEGRRLDAKRRIWSQRRALALVKERSRERDGKGGVVSRTVDLHGLIVGEALVVVRTSLDEWWLKVQGTLSPPPLRIITGVGRHSANNNPVILPAVTKLLDRDGWKWVYDGVGVTNSRGAVLIRGKK